MVVCFGIHLLIDAFNSSIRVDYKFFTNELFIYNLFENCTILCLLTVNSCFVGYLPSSTELKNLFVMAFINEKCILPFLLRIDGLLTHSSNYSKLQIVLANYVATQ